MTDQPFRPEPHQRLIDGLTALILTGEMDKPEALKIIAYYNEVHPEASWLDESVLIQIRKDLGLSLSPRPSMWKSGSMSFSNWIDRFVEIGQS